ncbi:carbohydrate-binding domain-containing protein, partial [Hominenteromicrobium sp.]|uniref:carbohydrate-binding domain-containing protein n=1 Tax=Hominenteromicrobium sp. TaxID=3073581 RepID=UPI003AB36F7F
MKPNRLSTKKHTLRFAVILSALILAGCASTQSTTSSTSVSSASSTVSTASTSEESGADETDSTGGAMNGTIGSVIEANLSFKNKDFYIDYSTEDTVKIDLSAPKEADGVKVSGSTVTITEAGTYVLSGTLTDGQVIIDAGDEDDVRLVFENASITCTTTAPINAKNADKVIISLPENTESTVTDTVTGTDGNDALTAAIFAKCDLSVNGTGTLNVNANANDGITSEDKLKITGGVLNITSADDGLVGKDAVLIKDGTVHITASGNGIKSTKSEADKGYVYIGGGTVNITAEQDGIQAETSVLISAGEVNVTAGGGANGEQKMGNAMFGGAQS